MNGVPLPLAVMMTDPGARGRHDPDITREKRDLYHYYATMMEPWDGPAAILFTDGDTARRGAQTGTGSRPSRYYITNRQTPRSFPREVGVLDIPAEQIECKTPPPAGQDAPRRHRREAASSPTSECKELLRDAASPTANGSTDI